jgi:hypothetical protein
LSPLLLSIFHIFAQNFHHENNRHHRRPRTRSNS